MIVDIGISVFIALLLNVFAHQIAYTTYKKCLYKEKFEKSTILLFVCGIIAIVLGMFIGAQHEKYSDSVVSYGFILGGILLMSTVILVTWGSLSDQLKLVVSGVVFFTVVYVCHKYYQVLKDYIHALM